MSPNTPEPTTSKVVLEDFVKPLMSKTPVDTSSGCGTLFVGRKASGFKL